jgi:hypothetical protein
MMTKRDLRDDIMYSIVALKLSASDIAQAVQGVTGLTVHATASNSFQRLTRVQLEAVHRRLLEPGRWSGQAPIIFSKRIAIGEHRE